MKRVALLGMPNTGKSTLFNRLTGSHARVGNWPGVTVDLATAKVLVGAHMVELVDLPGLYDLHGFSDDELVARHFLEAARVDAVVVVLNSSQVDRQLALALQVKALELPTLVVLNMADEAKRFGIEIDVERLSHGMGMPAAALSARYGTGVPEALARLAHILDTAGPPREASVRAALAEDHRREEQIESLVKASVVVPERLSEHASDRIDRVVLHPWLGLPLFFLAMLAVFQAVFWLGSPLQDGVEALFELVRKSALEPLLAPLPSFVGGLLLDGVWAGIGTVAAFVPLIVVFFFFLAAVEDSGYLSRAAFLTDAFMARLGLDGRAFVMLLMGFGCNVPALMGTRVMRDRPMRLLSMLTIPMSLCSARLQVFVFLAAAVFAPRHAPWVLFGLYVASFAAVIVTALLFRHRFASREPFVIELPPYRLPTLRQVWLRGWTEVKHFLQRATRFIFVGVIAVWLLTHLPAGAAPAGPDTIAGWIGSALQPVLGPLGIDEKLAVALIFGFVAKEVVIGAFAVIYGLEGDALAAGLAQSMDWVAATSFMIFTLVYTPCLSTVATLRTESRSFGFTALAVGWPLVLAWVASFLFYQGMRALGF
ncbi:MAG TPA: ferrous iron transport protein B [Usitatibacteraceae bacterium]|nr:ferrous iron transport protein B [Usitatibacteraceae bacterium]